MSMSCQRKISFHEMSEMGVWYIRMRKYLQVTESSRLFWNRQITLISHLKFFFPRTFFVPTSPAGSVFMCRLCNLFSPSRPLLLAHCSQLHPQQEPPDDIIIALQPLVAEPAGTLTGPISHYQDHYSLNLNLKPTSFLRLIMIYRH